MFDSRGVLVSAPASDIAKFNIPGSVFDLGHVLDQPLSPDLHAALSLVHEICRDRDVPAMMVARPEMFTNGETTRWLSDKLGDIVDHICISDGRTIRVIPGMNNHVFMIRLGIRKNLESFRRLRKRCPELLGTLQSQINSAFHIRMYQSEYMLPTVVLQPHLMALGAPPSLLPFLMIRHSIEASADLIQAHQVVDPEAVLGRLKHLSYFPLSDVALQSEGYCTLVAEAISKAYFDRTHGVILRLPCLRPLAAEDLKAQLTATLSGLRDIPAGIPTLPTDNVLLATADCDDSLQPSEGRFLDLVLHDSIEFWRHPPEFYERFDRVTLAASCDQDDRAGLIELMSHGMGRTPETHWLEYLSLELNDTEPVATW